MKLLISIAGVLLAMQALAGNQPKHGATEHHGNHSISTDVDINSNRAASNARSDADARATSTASTSSDAHSISTGGDQTISITGARQIASLAQGSWAAPECGTGGNAGGSGGGGAGFLGLYWTPADCKLMSIAYTWAHLGMFGEACKTLSATSTLRSAYKRYDLPLPDCTALITALTKPAIEEETITTPLPKTIPDMGEYATKEDLKNYPTRQEAERMFRQSVSK